MRRISPAEVQATHRIFNHVESVIGPYYVGPYYGKKTRDQARGYVSQNRWIMFPEYHIDSLREGALLPIPNVYVSFDPPEIKDDRTGKVEGWIGLTYHNVDSMIWLAEILKRQKRSALFISMLQALGNDWAVYIVNKTLTDCPDNTPKYGTFKEFRPSTVTADKIQKAVVASDRQLLRRGDPYPVDGNPVIWDVTVFQVSKWTTPSEFDDDVRVSFDLFFKALSLK